MPYKILFDTVFPFGSFLRKVDERKSFEGWQQLIFRVIPVTLFVYWLFSFIPFGGLFYFLAMTSVAVNLHISIRKITSKQEQLKLWLWYFVVVICGFGSIRNFVGHFFLADFVANQIGWQTGSPFQTELAFFHLGLGCAGLCAIWIRKNLVEGVALIKSVFLMGASYVHIRDIVLYNNISPYNVGSILVGDIVIPIIFFYLLYKTRGFKNETTESV